MTYFPPATQLVLYSDFSAEECARRLCGSMDAEKPTLFGFSGYRGSKPFVGNVHGERVRIIQRIYSSRNTLPAVFTGRLQAQGSGTQIRGSFDLELTSKIFISILSILGLLFLIFIGIVSYKSHPVLFVMFAFGYGGMVIFSPRIFRQQARSQEKDIANFLKETLVATCEPYTNSTPTPFAKS